MREILCYKNKINQNWITGRKLQQHKRKKYCGRVQICLLEEWYRKYVLNDRNRSKITFVKFYEKIQNKTKSIVEEELTIIIKNKLIK